MKVPSLKQVEEILKSTDTDAVSLAWVQRKFNLGYLKAKELFQNMQSNGLINGEGRIKVEKYPIDEF